MRDVHRPQHGVYVQTTTIGRQWRQLKDRKVIATKLVEEVGNFFGEVAQLAMFAKPYLVRAYHLLPPQRPPANGVVTPSSKMVGDLTPPLGTAARAQISQRMPRQRPLSGSSPCPRSIHHLLLRVMKHYNSNESV